MRKKISGSIKENIQDNMIHYIDYTFMENDLVTVVTPTFNTAHFVKQTIESVQAQTYKNWEMIIVDDCSLDNTCEIVEEKAKTDDRVRLIRLSQNAGVAVSRNTAIEAANGRYIAFLDSDDLWLPDKLQKQIGFMQKYNCALSYAAYKKIDEAGSIISDTVKVPERVNYKRLLLSCVIGCLTAIYDTKILGKVHLPLKNHEDYGLWLKILKMGYEAYGLNECLALYRIRNKSVSSNKLKAASYQWKIYREVEKLPLHKSIWYFINYAYYGYKKMKI